MCIIYWIKVQENEQRYYKAKNVKRAEILKYKNIKDEAVIKF